jgi:hypothetical protein
MTLDQAKQALLEIFTVGLAAVVFAIALKVL